MARFTLDMDAIKEQVHLALEGFLTDPDVLREILESSVTIIRPGDTVFLRFTRALPMITVDRIFHLLQPIAEQNGFSVAVIDECDNFYVMRREDYAQSQQHSHAHEEEHSEPLPNPSPSPSVASVGGGGSGS